MKTGSTALATSKLSFRVRTADEIAAIVLSYATSRGIDSIADWDAFLSSGAVDAGERKIIKLLIEVTEG